MNNKRADITQIRKYLNGELDARAMHRLEVEAQNDPFLMDALEGFEHAGPDQQHRLTDLNQRLQARINQGKRRIGPLIPLSIAASILVLFTVGIFIWRDQPYPVPVHQTVAIMHKPQSKMQTKPGIVQFGADTPSAPVQTHYPRVYAGAAVQQAGKERASGATLTVVSPSPQLYLKSSPKPAAQRVAVTGIKPEDLLKKMPGIQVDEDTDVSGVHNVPIQGRVAGVEVTTPEGISGTVTDLKGSPLMGAVITMNGAIAATTNQHGNFSLPQAAANQTVNVSHDGYESGYLTLNTKADTVQVALTPSSSLANLSGRPSANFKKEYQAKAAPALNEVSINNGIVKGIVKDPDGQPLPGATVMVKGKSNGTQTDAQGRFTLYGVTNNTVLTVAFVGFQTRELKARPNDQLDVQLSASQSALSEVVVVGYGTEKKEKITGQPQRPAATPQEFKQYLTDNAKLPDGKQGKVKVSFIVQPNGDLTDFKIIKSLSPEADAKAIQLIKDGPSWLAGSDNEARQVRVKVVFH